MGPPGLQGCGMNGFLSKPINLEEVIQTLQSVFYQT